MSKQTDKKKTNNKINIKETMPGYLYNMSMAPKPGQGYHWFQMVPAIFFTAFIIMITRMSTYERPMSQFYWSTDATQLNDFFSYYKMIAIVICAVFVLILLLYRIFAQTFIIKRTYIYVPMAIYTAFVLLSYFFSNYKLFALWGWNDRFEGTLATLSYIVLLFYIINTVNSEKGVKFIVYATAFSSAILGLLGITQALDYDFFRTSIGKKLITPSWFWSQIDSLNFTFQNKEIYQTVYNINYVSFYLTLLIPLFGMLFIRSVLLYDKESLFKKILWGILFSILIFNMIGSSSSGGFLGLAAILVMAIIIFNKRIIEWRKPLLVLVVISIIIGGISYQRWFPELSYAVKGVLDSSNQQAQTDLVNDNTRKHKLDYFITSGDAIVMEYEGNKVKLKTYSNDPSALKITDSKNKVLRLIPTDESPIYAFEDKRFYGLTIRPAVDESGTHYFIIMTDGNGWPFALTNDGVKYLTPLGKTINLHKVPAIGWSNNQSFGSGRGYIWSRTIPMIKDTLIIGHGADTFCLYFPHDDYVGKYNSGTFSPNINIFVDKPHSMYLGTIINTGMISMLSLIAIWFLYITQSIKIYYKKKHNGFLFYAGSGIFLGICGFVVSATVNDSSVSVMPMFYGLLGTGIAINILLKNGVAE